MISVHDKDKVNNVTIFQHLSAVFSLLITFSFLDTFSSIDFDESYSWFSSSITGQKYHILVNHYMNYNNKGKHNHKFPVQGNRGIYLKEYRWKITI